MGIEVDALTPDRCGKIEPAAGRQYPFQFLQASDVA